METQANNDLHVAIIMDGNGRWATARGLPRTAGHQAGVDALRRTVECAPGLGISTLTAYAFSADNWRRPPAEVSMLMALLRRYLRDEVARLVLLTERHAPTDDDVNGCVISDADLAILAATPERYAEYAADVRREYAEVPDDLFRHGRAAVLGDLLAKRSLFHTAHAREHWEAPARANVVAELVLLGG